MGSALSAVPVPTREYATTSGPVRGRVFTLPSGARSLAFLGIPYGQPRRFQKAEPSPSWTETRDCFLFGPRCPQIDEHFTDRLAQSAVPDDEEACLNLNVFAPPKAEGLPVMVWIHGGGYMMHSAAHYGDTEISRNLCEKGVVVVTLNYRLGIFGFFTTGDKFAPGNLGLWDMTLALRWVKENIAVFGGDPRNVTLFGHSAGGCAVDCLSLSPHTRGLFRRVIVMSGNAECDFATRSTRSQREICMKFAAFEGFQPRDDGIFDSQEVVDYLRRLPDSQLRMNIRGRKGFETHGQLLFVPHLDGDFFPRSLEQLRREMPLMECIVGTTEYEGLYFTALSGIPKTSQALRDFVALSVADLDVENAETATARLSALYLNPVHNKNDLVHQFCKLFGDVTLNNGSFEYAQKMAALGHRVFFYSFDYCNPRGFGLLTFILPFRAATHGSELRYVLGKGLISKFRPSEDDLKMLQRMTTYFTNFAKFGNPNGSKEDGEWKLHQASQPFKHFSISLQPEMKEDYQERRAAVWADVRRFDLHLTDRQR